MTTLKKFELFEHTADVGIIAYGKTLSEAFENAALGMFEIIHSLSKIKAVGEYKISLEANDLEQLLVKWLSELLFIHETQQVVFSKFKVELEPEKFKLIGHAYGEKLNPKKHKCKTEIKAVTYHMLEVKKVNEIWIIKVLFDI